MSRQLNKKQKNELRSIAERQFNSDPVPLGMSTDDMSVDARNRIAGYNDHETVFSNMDRFLNEMWVGLKYKR